MAFVNIGAGAVDYHVVRLVDIPTIFSVAVHCALYVANDVHSGIFTFVGSNIKAEVSCRGDYETCIVVKLTTHTYIKVIGVQSFMSE